MRMVDNIIMPNKKTNTNTVPLTTPIILLSLFIISISLFAFQVTLTRLYSAILSYHYVFLTTSLAILGVGVGSILAYWDRSGLKKNIDQDPASPLQLERLMVQVNKWSLILTYAFAAVFILIYIQPFIDSLIVYVILGITPFIVSGYLYALLFKSLPQISGKLYFSDLIGAGAGSIAIVLLLDNLGMFKTAVFICLLPLTVTLILPSISKKQKIIKYAVSVFLAAVLFIPMQFSNSIETNFYALLNNTGKSYGEMQRSGLAPEIIFSRWDSFARTDLIRLGAIPEVKFITIDGAANAPMYVFDGNIESLDVFKMNTGYIPFEIGSSDKTLIIGAGGGRGVLYALAAGSGDITAVEINEASIEAVRMFGDFNGHIFDRPEVRVYAQDGRNFIRTTEERFDLIFLSLVVTNTTQGVGFALSENYIHTVEAMEDYLSSLTYNGRVVFVAHDQNSLIRLTTTAIQALLNRGVLLQDTPDYIATFYQLAEIGGAVQMVAPVIIVKNEPFIESESEILLREILNIGATPEYIPHLHEQGAISQIKNGQISFDQFIAGFDLRAEPVTDNSPYFFNFERGVPTVLLQILAFGLIGTLLLLVPHLKKRGALKPAIYFGLLGMGFMMIQIPLIQKFILYLGHPTPAFSYTLAAMLIGCGIGGFFSGYKLFKKTLGRIYLPPVMAAAVIFVLLLLLNPIFQMTAGFNIVLKIIIAATIAAIPGFFIGMPFPRGLAILGESNRKDIIPIMWGVNGTMSITGSVVSIILSMTFGFSTALIGGAVIYILIGFFREI